MKFSVRPSPKKKTGVKKDGGVTHEALRQQLLRVNSLAGNWKTRLQPYERKRLETIRTASDCSGYGSDLIAYKLLGQHARTCASSADVRNRSAQSGVA